MPKAYIIGLGRSAIAAAKLLKLDHWNVEISDRANSPHLLQLQQQLGAEQIRVKLSHTPSLDPNLPDLIVVSPGVPWDIPLLVEARKKGIDVVGEIELAWRYLNHVPWVGITGTNGKTTTTALVAAIFQAAGKDAPACGNIGYAACELAIDKIKSGRKYDWIVAELSSYQIEASSLLKPRIGIWTTFTPDHLDRHKTLDNYYQIKASLLHRSNQQVINGDDVYLYSKRDEWSNAYWTNITASAELDSSRSVYLEDAWIKAFDELIMPASIFQMPGEHNQQNLLMAIAAARLAHIPKGAIVDGISTFPGVPHRLQYIRTYRGVDWINDSKATNYDAATVGLASVDAPVVLIAGGEAKQGDDTAWLQQIQQKTHTVLLIGAAASQFASRLEAVGYRNYQILSTMTQAVERAAEIVYHNCEIATVLLSPACASFDQYRSFEHRGDDFRQLCLALS